jgi:hypothetical protein
MEATVKAFEKALEERRAINGVPTAKEQRPPISPEAHEQAITKARELALEDLAYHERCAGEIRKALGLPSRAVAEVAEGPAFWVSKQLGKGEERVRAARTKKAGPGKVRRLPRRSSEQIAEMLTTVTTAILNAEKGLRAEELRVAIGAEAKEMPRILKTGLKTGVLRCTGQKRATVYFLKSPARKKR